MPELYIPTLWDKKWKEATDQAEGVEKLLLSIQARAAHLLQNIDDTEATPQRLAWMILWTRVFLALEGAQACLLKNSGFTLELLGRTVDETNLIVQTIAEPQTTWEDSGRERLERLTAYTAWCLWNDMQVYERMRSRRNMDALYGDSVLSDIVGDELKLEAYERFFGPLEIQDPDEMDRQRRIAEEKTRETVQRIRSYLSQPELAPWLHRLEDRHQKRNWIRNFFELLNDRENSVSRRLQSLGMGFAYSVYQTRSNILHGSTFDNILLWSGDTIIPKALNSDDQADSPADYIG